jgi:hypothetical protein
VVTKAYTANDKQVRLQGHTESDTQAHTKIFVQKKSRFVDAKIIFKRTSQIFCGEFVDYRSWLGVLCKQRLFVKIVNLCSMQLN